MKLLFIPAFLGLVLFVLYAQSMEDTEGIYMEETASLQYVELAKKDEVFTSNYEKPLIVKKKAVKKKAVKKEESPLTVDIGTDINTTRDKEVTLTAYVENLGEEEGCNYFWRDGKKLLGMGDTISVSFKKGKHNIHLYVLATNGREINTSKLITAWEYTKEARLYYNEKTGEFMHKKVTTYDYQDNLIQVKGHNFLRTYSYDENGQELEMHYDNYKYTEYSHSSSAEYDDNGNMVKSESLDADGRVVWREAGEYDDENETISYKMGEDENHLEEIMGDEEEAEEEESLEDDEIEGVNDDEKLVYDENNNLLKSKYSYGTTVMTSEMLYDENNQTIQEISSTKDGNYSYSTTYKYAYDEEGNVVSLEKELSENGKVYCHYNTESTYNSDGYVLIEKNKILSGDCSGDVYDLYIENTYDKEGNIINTKSKTYTKENEKEMKDEISEMHRTMKRENYYSNDLDD